MLRAAAIFVLSFNKTRKGRRCVIVFTARARKRRLIVCISSIYYVTIKCHLHQNICSGHSGVILSGTFIVDAKKLLIFRVVRETRSRQA